MTTSTPHNWLADHSIIVTALLLLMSLACAGYTIWVILLDIRETRAEHETDAAQWDTIKSNHTDTGSSA